MKLTVLLAAFALPCAVLGDPPPSDNVAQAMTMTWPASAGASTAAALNTTGATSEPGEPAHGGVAAARSVWWKFTAGQTGAAAISVRFRGVEVTSPPLNGSAGVYEGSSVAALTPLTPLGTGIYPVTAGKTYLVAANDSPAQSGEVSCWLTRLKLEPYPNDAFAARVSANVETTLDLSRYPFGDTWYSASVEAGEPPLPAGSSGVPETLWWEYTPAVTGWYQPEGFGSYDPFPGIEAFTGSTLESLQLIAPRVLDSTAALKTQYYHLQAGQPVIFRRTLSGAAGMQSFYVGRPEAYETFLLEGQVPSGNQAFEDNPSGDGVSNLSKFVLGLDPSRDVTQDPRAGHLPRVSRRADGRMEVAFTVDLRAVEDFREFYDDVYITPDVSSDMIRWWRLGGEFDPGDDETIRFKEYRYVLPETANRVFVRLRVDLEFDVD